VLRGLGPVGSCVFRVFTGKRPNVMVAANYLPAPWCYVVTVGAALVAFGVIAGLETRRKAAG
jgi:hypothetical protein